MSTSGDQSATAKLWISPLPILEGKPPKKIRFKRFCASSISLSGFHVVTLFNVFIFFIFLDLVKALSVHRANRLLSGSTLILRTLRRRPGGKQTPGEFTGGHSVDQ